MDADMTGVCPACGGPAMPIGVLGRRLHQRCRDCGMDSSRKYDGKFHEDYDLDHDHDGD